VASLREWPERDFSRTTGLCVGDVMIDRYMLGEVRRISPEAPVPFLPLAASGFYVFLALRLEVGRVLGEVRRALGVRQGYAEAMRRHGGL
jgi:hypothetical protein